MDARRVTRCCPGSGLALGFLLRPCTAGLRGRFALLFASSVSPSGKGTARCLVARADVLRFLLSSGALAVETEGVEEAATAARRARVPVSGWRFSFSTAASVDRQVASAGTLEGVSRPSCACEGVSRKTANERVDMDDVENATDDDGDDDGDDGSDERKNEHTKIRKPKSGTARAEPRLRHRNSDAARHGGRTAATGCDVQGLHARRRCRRRRRRQKPMRVCDGEDGVEAPGFAVVGVSAASRVLGVDIMTPPAVSEQLVLVPDDGLVRGCDDELADGRDVQLDSLASHKPTRLSASCWPRRGCTGYI